MSAQHCTGTVRWFNDNKGYGFLTSPDVPADIFAHYSAIDMEGFRCLRPDQRVTFFVEKTEKGYQARKIKVVE